MYKRKQNQLTQEILLPSDHSLSTKDWLDKGLYSFLTKTKTIIDWLLVRAALENGQINLWAAKPSEWHKRPVLFGKSEEKHSRREVYDAVCNGSQGFFFFFFSFGFVGLFLVLRSCTVPADLSTYACPSYIVITQCDLSYEAGDCIGLKTHE